MTRPRAACVTCSLLDDRERIAIRLLDPSFQIGLAVRVEPLAALDGCGGPQRTQNSYDSFFLRYSSSGRIIRIPASQASDVGSIPFAPLSKLLISRNLQKTSGAIRGLQGPLDA